MRRERILQTERLVLTSWVSSDVDELCAVHSDPDTMRFVRHGRPETREETAALVDQYIAEQRDSGYTKWRLADVEGRLVGRAGFGRDRQGRQLAYTIRREHWGYGLATEIATALVDWHLVHAATTPLYALVATENPASRRVLAKTGFQTLGSEEHSGVPCELLGLRPQSPSMARRQP